MRESFLMNAKFCFAFEVRRATTLKRFLTFKGVDSTMAFQITLASEREIALFARKWFFFGVSFLMNYECTFLFKFRGTKLTFERSFTAMNSFVHPEVAACFKSGRAYVTLKRFFIGVYESV